MATFLVYVRSEELIRYFTIFQFVFKSFKSRFHARLVVPVNRDATRT